jgi:outer membrane protein assembly factor BamD
VRRAALLALALALPACAARRDADIQKLASSSDQVVWEAGQEALQNESWAAAREYFRRLVDGFPQSQYGPAARLGLADAYFQEGGRANRILAVAAYQEFLTLYPSHPRADYAQFMVGESNFSQRHGPDRDQTPVQEALQDYNRLLDFYPNSPYLESARARIQECRQSLARSEFLVGYFYQRTRRVPRAAVNRYQRVLEKYPDYEGIDEVLYRLGEVLVDAERHAEALPYLNRLIEVYPDSEWVEEAREVLARVPEDVDALTPPPSPAPSEPEPSSDT